MLSSFLQRVRESARADRESAQGAGRTKSTHAKTPPVSVRTFEPRYLHSLMVDRVCLAAQAQYRVRDCLVYSNMTQFDEVAATHYSKDVYCERHARMNPIDLVRLDRPTIHPQDYIVSVGESVIKEQLPPWEAGTSAVAISSSARSQTVKAETVIVARYGAWTWGHWLGELLPKLVMVERAFPGRFTFAVPQTYQVPKWQTFRESLSAYGIPTSRLLLLDPDCAYTLRRGWAVSPVWSDHVMHPEALDAMRKALVTPRISKGHGKIALLRRKIAARSLNNWDEIALHLAGHGYKTIDTEEMSFAEQVEAFRGADSVFGTLGSGLSGLIFSPDGVGVTSVAPYLFGDRFFYALLAARGGYFADIRGPIACPDPKIPHRSSFTVNRDDVSRALAAMELARNGM